MAQRQSKEQIIIKEASAGSGKTYALAQRYIELILGNLAAEKKTGINNILAITFTNKAALEMKDRIILNLKKIALDIFDTPKEKADIYFSLSLKEHTARPAAASALDEIMRNYDFFQVKTIDSFINSMLTGCSFKLGLTSGFRIEHEVGDYLEYSLDRLFDNMGADKELAALFDDYLTNYLIVEGKDGWMIKKDLMEIAAQLFNVTNIYGKTITLSRYGGKDIIAARNRALELIGKLSSDIPEGMNGTFANSLMKFAGSMVKGFDLGALPAAFKKELVPMNKNRLAPQKTEKLWRDIREALRALAEIEALSRYNSYAGIYKNMSEALESVSQTEDILFLAELNRKAAALVDNNAVTVDELYLRIAARLKDFLLDEFQDTSVLQWKNFLPMIIDALARGGSLFLVGDKKQAIYRFRGGDIRLFDVAEGAFGSSAVSKEVLSKNYRSLEEVVRFNNKIFSKENIDRFTSLLVHEAFDKLNINSEREELSYPGYVYSGSTQTVNDAKTGGYVSVEYTEEEDIDDRDRIIRPKIVETVKDAGKRYGYGRVAVLLRSGNEIEKVTSWLLKELIPVESDKTMNIKEHAVIKELVSFLKFLDSPVDNLAFAAFITGNIFLKASALSAEEIEEFMLSKRALMMQRGEKRYLYKYFRDAYPAIWGELISVFFKKVGVVPLYELTVSIYNRFKVAENNPKSAGFVMRFLELIREREEKDVSLSVFLESFEQLRGAELYVRAGAERNAVQLMTIHKAKGLEFDVVVIPFFTLALKLSAPTSNDGPRGSRPSYLVWPDAGTLKLVSKDQKYIPFSPALKEIYKAEYMKSLIDELNVAYVALTRAREEMYIFVPKRAGAHNNAAALLLNIGSGRFGNKIDPGRGRVKKSGETVRLSPKSQCNWIDYIEHELAGGWDIKSRKDVIKGNVLHAAMSLLGNLYGKDAMKELEKAAERTFFMFKNIENTDDYKAVIRRIVTDKKFERLFVVENGAVYVEKEMIDAFGARKRADRVVVTENEVLVADFKSTLSPGAIVGYKAQVRGYVEIMKEIYPDKKCLGFLVDMQRAILEEI